MYEKSLVLQRMETNEKSRIMKLSDICTPRFSKNLTFVTLKWFCNGKELKYQQTLSSLVKNCWVCPCWEKCCVHLPYIFAEFHVSRLWPPPDSSIANHASESQARISEKVISGERLLSSGFGKNLALPTLRLKLKSKYRFNSK